MMKKFKTKIISISHEIKHKSAGSSSNKRYSTSVAGGYSSMNAYEPALKVRPLPPLPGKERVNILLVISSIQ
jgi:hypothetical protein